MNLETVADFGKTPFIYVFVVKYFLNSLSCPIMLNNFYSDQHLSEVILPIGSWLVVCFRYWKTGWKAAVGKRVNIGDEVLSFR